MTRQRRLADWLWLAPALLTAALAVPLIAVNYGGSIDGARAHSLRAADDQNRYHLLVVERFAKELPRPDLSDYPSATTPGFHLLMALAKRGLGLSEQALRGLNLLVTLLLLGLLGWTLSRWTSPAMAAALSAPLACSLYVLSSAAWLLPDNAAWLLLCTMLLLLWEGPVSARRTLLAAALLVALVAVRQSHIWAASLLWTAAWLDSAEPAQRRDALLPTPASVRAWRTLLLRLGANVVATLPAFALLMWFVRLWGGLTPPTFQEDLARPNPATPGLALALLGIYAAFHAGCALPALAGLRDRGRLLRLALLGAAVGLVLGLAPRSTYAIAEGRFSGLWNLIRLTPDVGGRSPLFVGLAAWGGCCAGLWLAVAPTRPRWLVTTSGVAFISAMTVNAMSWQRYLEPGLLLLTALAAATLWRSVPQERRRRAARWAWLGPTALAAALLVVSLRSLQIL